MLLSKRNAADGRKTTSTVIATVLVAALVLAGAPVAPAAAETSGGGGSRSLVADGTTPPVDDSGTENPSNGAALSGAPESSQAAAEAPLSSDPAPVAGEVRADGLVYRVLSDGASVALVGCDESLAGDVVVPARATSGSYSYSVVAVGEPGKAADGEAPESDPAAAGLAGEPGAKGVLAGSSVESVTIPSTVKTVEPGALSGCPTLKRVLVSSDNETYASFDGMLFSKDSTDLLLVPEGKEGSASIPDQAATVPAGAFSRCDRLQAVLVGEGNAALASRNGLLFTKDLKMLLACAPGAGDAVVVPLGVEAIGPRAFAGCEVASIAALGDVREIAADAFDEAAKSAVVALPSDGRETRKAVWEAAGFSRFADPANPGDTSSPDGEGGPDANPDPDGSEPGSDQQVAGLAFTLLDDYTLSVAWAGESEPVADLEIPATAEIDGASYRVSAVAPSGFEGLASLESVKLPAGVVSIGDAAFAGCSKLATIGLSDGLQTVGERAFEGAALTELWLPASVESLGSRALADCKSLERVVSLGTPEAASDILAGCSGVTVYCQLGSEGSWNIGLPAQGNHLAPYGVELAPEPVALAAGESANLLEGGAVEAPEPVQASYSYAAKPLSVDEQGVATGKSEGATEVAVALTLDGTEIARASRSVEVAPGDGGLDVPMVNETAALLPAATLAGERAAATQLSVTAPIAVTFGGSAGYDVSSGVTSVTAPVTFENNSAVRTRITALKSTDKGVSNVLEATSGSLASQNLFSLYPNASASQVASFTPSGSVTPAAGYFDVPAKGTLDCTYRLNLSAAKVKASIADGGASVKALANVAYTFEAFPEGHGSVNDAFYLKDSATGQVFNASDLKTHANDISAYGEGSPCYAMYLAFAKGTRAYECKVKWGDGITYDVNVVGVNHDDKVAGGKAGLTFQFKNLLNTSYRMNSANVNAGGWGASELRARMNPGTDTVANGTDNNAIWNQVPSELQSAIAPVKKKYNPTSTSNNATVSTSNDSLFLATYVEHSNSIYASWNSSYPWLSAEGSQYEYWQGKVSNNWGANTSLVKGKQSSPSTAAIWWGRSVYPGYTGYFLSVHSSGGPSYGDNASNGWGVCPCFSL